MLQEIKRRLRNLANPERAKVSRSYFKTGPGQYGEGDRFLGNTVPDLRRLAKEYQDLHVDDLLQLLHSPVHEERVLALLILNLQFRSGTEAQRKAIYRLYLDNTSWINNWDLVDCSAEIIVGEYLLDKNTKLLEKLARSRSLWERRIAILSTFAFIKRNRFEPSLRIIESLINDQEDLIHKASGWMLREIGKRDLRVLKSFLNTHAATMPRTMLRYAIEKLPEPERRSYLALKSRS